MQNKKVVLILVVALLAIFFVSGYVYKNMQEKEELQKVQNNNTSLVRPYSYIDGKKDAKVELVEFFDPACGTCALFHPYVKEIMKQNKDDIKIVYRYAPFHKGSDKVVKLLEAAREQGKFKELLELLFVTQQYWVKHHVVQYDIVEKIAEKSNLLDMNKANEFMKNPKLDEIINQDLADAKALGANKTPSFFVNSKPLKEFGLEQLIELINSEL
ncbi:thioredoxin domain-containing protein [Arcobacter sp. YIC-464]|uniref:DsbA family protein n=1 Tax=Arcobacter sp. YIC-464 TaxID=3376631 RepID=UPI003C14E696